MAIRRRFSRWQIHKECRVKLEGALAFAPCIISDISLIGLKMRLPLKLPKDNFVRLSLILSEDFVLEIEAWAVWHKTTEGLNIYGLYFSKIRDPDKERIYQFIRRHFPDEVNKKWWQDAENKKGGEEMEDRRIFERFPVKLSLRFLRFSASRESLAQTLDISAKGLRVVADEELEPGTPLELWLEVPDQGEPIYIRGMVAWSEAQGANQYLLGVNLEKANLMALSRVLRKA